MPRNTWFNIRAAASDQLVIDIFDEIGFFGVTAKDFAAQLKAYGKPKKIEMNLDTPGGDCNDGFTIYDGLINSGAEITVNIVGLAASMGSVIMLAGNKIRIAENGRVMIHRVQGGAYGDADEMDAAAKVIKQFEDRIVQLYMGRTQKDETEVRDLMKAQMGTWFFGQEAIDAGFADELISGTKAKAFKPQWAAKFEYLPAALFDTSAPSTAHADHPTLTTEQMKALLALAKKIGIAFADNATEDQILAAIDGWKPAFDINIEDPQVTASIDQRITAATAADKTKITALEGEITNLKALITNGAAIAAGGNAAVSAASKPTSQLTIAEQYAAIADAAERTRFYNKHREELRKPSNLFQAAA